MENLLVFGVIALMSLGLISLGELIVRSIKTPSPKPVDYTPIAGALEGLNGAETRDISHFFSAIASHLSHALEHFHHH